MQERNERRSNASRTETTRAALVEAARALFAENGYAETSTPEIVRAAGVTRGALYHHFADKEALFRAVVTAEFDAVAAEINAAATTAPGHARAALLLGSRAYLTAMQVPGRVRLLLRDGPAVLGQAALDDIDRASASESLAEGLAAAQAAGELRDLPLAATTQLLSALFDRAALAVADGQDIEDLMAVIEAVLEGLAPPR